MINFKSMHTKLLLIIVAFICTILSLVLLNVSYAEPASAASESDLTFTDIGNGYSVKARDEYGKMSGTLNIPASYNGKPVIRIDNYAFWYSNITSVTIPDSITSIGDYAFRGCDSLANVTVGSGVTDFGMLIFQSCTRLESVTLSNSLTTIGDSMFFGCSALKTITLPNSLTVIKNYAFEDCTSLSSVTIPNSVTSIEHYAFSGCKSLSTLTYEGTKEEWNKIKIGGMAIPGNTKIIYVDLIVSVDNYGISNSDVNVKFTGKSVTGYYSKSLTGYPISARNWFASDTNFSADGYYRVETRCSYTSKVVAYFIVDKTAPQIGTYNEFTNTEFTMTASDNITGVAAWEYRFNDGEILQVESTSVTLGGEKYGDGIWTIRAIDAAGNATEWITVNYVHREVFGNSDKIYNSYFMPAYFTATLTQKNYPNSYGTYTFSDYDSALSFTTQKEWEYRVIVMDGGNAWNYVSTSNESTRQIYTDRAELDAAIDKYARKNVSDRKIMSKNGNVLNNPTDSNGVTRVDALTQQLSSLPTLLSQYSDCRFMLALLDDYLNAPKGILEGNKVTASIQFISDGISLRPGSVLELKYGIAFKEVVHEQGWYLITESDVCGNVEKYLIFLDLQQPDVSAEVKYGNGNAETVSFNQTYIEENAGAMRYVSMDINSLADNIDEFIMVAISGRNLDQQYLWGDELPVLSYENGYYGAYTITAYDRSHNAISFVVYIAGASPTLKNTSLTSETSCTFTVQINDNYNEITDIKVFKVYYDGTEERLFFDSFDTEICPQNLVYKIAVGGKYVFVFTDLYGRTVRTNPIFYMKGLPVATLKGVSDGGLTKNDVSVIFTSDADAELYALRNGEWALTELYEVSQGVSNKTLKITASPETTAVFKVLIFITTDRNLFTEYTFEIDGIPPYVAIMAESGEMVMQDTVTTKSFKVDWIEAGYKAYYKKVNALSDETYVKGSYIRTAGAYEFTIYDSACNELSFTVTLDNTVSYTLEGNYVVMEDVYVTRNYFVFTLTEPWSEFEVNADNGLSIINGQKINIDGTYIVSVKDSYGNALSLTLLVDKTPPVPIILTEDGKTISAGTRINCGFSVLCNEEDVGITFSKGMDYVAYDGSLLNDAGTYAFILTDKIGNSTEIKVIIDRNISFRVNGTYVFDADGNYVSKSWLSVSLSEEMSTFCITAEDGTTYGAEERITAEGKYELFCRDTSGNDLSNLFLIIDKTPPSIKLDGVLPDGATSGTVKVEFLDASESWYSLNGGTKQPIADGQDFIFEGAYTVTASDVAGNAVSVSFVIDRTVDVKPSIALVSGQIISESVSFVFGETVTALLYKDGAENLYTRGEISAPGEYRLSINDNYDNEKVFNWIIVPQRAREYSIKVDGLYVAVNKDGKVYSAAIDNGVLALNETGFYLLEFNSAGGSWTLDLEVDRVVPTVVLENTGKSIKISEPNKNGVTYTLYLNGKKKAFSLSKMTELTDKGKYRLVCEDELGNVSEYEFELQYLGGTTIILIVVASVLAAGGLVAVLFVRFKRKVF